MTPQQIKLNIKLINTKISNILREKVNQKRICCDIWHEEDIERKKY